MYDFENVCSALNKICKFLCGRNRCDHNIYVESIESAKMLIAKCMHETTS